MAVPTDRPARLDRDLDEVQVGVSLRLDLRLPVADLGLGLDRVELRHWGERGDR
jgi:hypothetical protein